MKTNSEIMKALTETRIQMILGLAKNNINALKTAKEMNINDGIFYQRCTSIEHLTGLNPREFYGLSKLIEIIENKKPTYESEEVEKVQAMSQYKIDIALAYAKNNMSALKAARSLYVSESTMHYQLKKIKQTSLNVRNFYELRKLTQILEDKGET